MSFRQTRTMYSKVGGDYGNISSSACYEEMVKEKGEFQTLNERFARYVQRMRDMRGQMGPGADVSGLIECIKSLENELNQLKSMYEAELAKLRRELEECCRLRGQENIDRQQWQQKLADTERQLREALDRLRQVCDENKGLNRRITELETELVSLRRAQSSQPDMGNLQVSYEAAKREADEANRRTAQLMRDLNDRDARLTQLEKELSFNRSVWDKERTDLQSRVEASGRTAHDLQEQLKHRPAPEKSTDLAAMMARIKQQTEDEFRRMKAENDGKFTATIESLRGQLSGDGGVRKQLESENDRLRRCIDELKGQMTSLQAQLHACSQEKSDLQQTLADERARWQARLNDCEARFTNLQSVIEGKLSQMLASQDNCVPLRAELESYRALLEDEEGRMNSLPPITRQAQADMTCVSQICAGRTGPSYRPYTAGASARSSSVKVQRVVERAKTPGSARGNTYESGFSSMQRTSKSYDSTAGGRTGAHQTMCYTNGQVNSSSPYQTYSAQQRGYPQAARYLQTRASNVAHSYQRPLMGGGNGLLQAKKSQSACCGSCAGGGVCDSVAKKQKPPASCNRYY